LVFFQAAQNVLNLGRDIIHRNRVYKPFSIDKRRLIINASNLCVEVVHLLAENILTNVNDLASDLTSVEYLNAMYAKISVNQDIGK
jgi:hypothetical protein